MKEVVMNSMTKAIGELERIFEHFAPMFDDTVLALPVITVQTRGRKRNTLGWFADKMWVDKKGHLPEINICAESLARNVEDVAEVVIHEMCHYYNALNKIKDCSPAQYHNRRFKEACNKIGLNCEKSDKRGWSSTSLTDELLTKVQQLKIDKDAFSIFRSTTVPMKAATKMLKWSCDCTNIRCAVELDAICNGCGKPFSCQA